MYATSSSSLERCCLYILRLEARYCGSHTDEASRFSGHPKPLQHKTRGWPNPFKPQVTSQKLVRLKTPRRKRELTLKATLIARRIRTIFSFAHVHPNIARYKFFHSTPIATEGISHYSMKNANSRAHPLQRRSK